MGQAVIRPKPVVLAVIDGWGVAVPWGGNASSLAKTPFFNLAKQRYPYTTLLASGAAVGLPPNERGNSEVGHLNIGSGQIAHEALPAITEAINDGSFFTNPVLVKAFEQANSSGRAVHIMGLTSNGGIHSHIDHLFALLDMAEKLGTKEICIHVITDGRDTPPFVAQEFCAKVNERLRQLGRGRICTVMGRYFAMDRDHRWDRIQKAYRAITEGVGPTARTAEAAVAAAYRDGFSDEFIPPTVIQGENNSFRPLQDGDSLIFYNFRGDRAREITQALVQPYIDDFPRIKRINNLYFVGFTYYKEGLPIEVAFRPKNVEFPLARVISEANLKQLHVAESEKYAHVTYFFNAGHEDPYPSEDRVVVPSPKVSSYDQTPQMATKEVTAEVLKGIDKYDFIILNYAAPDMVGHTGNLRSAIAACEAVDQSLAEIGQEVERRGGVFIVTADHGNVELMVNVKTGEPDTEHSANPVPFLLVSPHFLNRQLRNDGKLSDIAPTLIEIMSLSKPQEMTGQSLLMSTTPASSAATGVDASTQATETAPATR